MAKTITLTPKSFEGKPASVEVQYKHRQSPPQKMFVVYAEE